MCSSEWLFNEPKKVCERKKIKPSYTLFMCNVIGGAEPPIGDKEFHQTTTGFSCTLLHSFGAATRQDRQNMYELSDCTNYDDLFWTYHHLFTHVEAQNNNGSIHHLSSSLNDIMWQLYKKIPHSSMLEPISSHSVCSVCNRILTLQFECLVRFIRATKRYSFVIRWVDDRSPITV